jgi:antitoxin component HigA of HigAB toxin-antitoxin module
MVESQCSRCKHHIVSKPGELPNCKAFPTQIPLSLLRNQHDHRKPYPGDHGIRFEPIEAWWVREWPEYLKEMERELEARVARECKGKRLSLWVKRTLARANGTGPSAEQCESLASLFSMPPFESRQDYEAASAILDRLVVVKLGRGCYDPQSFIDALAYRSESYEAENTIPTKAPGRDVLRILIEEHAVTEAQLAADMKVSAATIAAVLSGKRRFGRTHAKALARFLKVPPDVFLVDDAGS